MSYQNKTYVIFDGDNDQWAYRFMKGWKANDNVDFDFEDAHAIFPLTYRAQDESYIKGKLKERLNRTSQVLVLIGEHTKDLYKYVRWEIEMAIDLRLPIVAVNLNEKRGMDSERCPAILRDKYVVHVPFKMKIIQYSLDNFPREFNSRKGNDEGNRIYPDSIYKELGLN